MRLSSHLTELRERGEKALVVFFTAGDPSLSALPEIISSLVEGGADAIEVGIPFSDPFGEGPTIQASSQRALDAGVSPGEILDVLATVSCPVPLLTMGYVNPAMRMGWEAFAARSEAAGVSGTILSDLVPDEADAWVDACARHNLGTVFLAAPTSTPERLNEVCRRSTGFVYAVSRTGVTGTENEVPADVGELVGRIRARTELPVMVGFGISTPAHVARVCAVADGAVVGSEVVRQLASGASRSEMVELIRSLKSATRQA